MTPARFSQIGELLYGTQWRTALAVELAVAERTVRRWAAGNNPIPDGIDSDLATLCRTKAEQLSRLADQLSKGVDRCK